MEKKNTARINFYATLIMYALIPLVTAGIIITFYLVKKSETAIENVTKAYLYSMAESMGLNLEDYIAGAGAEVALSEDVLTAFCAKAEFKDLDTAYCYVADADANMLYHPTKDKIGHPVSNSVILDVCARMASGESIQAEVVTYEYEGQNKYAAYYVAPDNAFVMVVTADATDVTKLTNPMLSAGIVIDVLMIILFGTIAMLIARIIATPLKQLAETNELLAEGNLNVEIHAKSHVKETVELINATCVLRDSLQQAVGLVKQNALSLDGAVVDVDDKTVHNASSTGQINDAIGEVADTSQAVAESAQRMSMVADELGASIDQLVENVENLKGASDEISQTNNEANKYMQIVLDSSTESVSAVSVISDRINETNDAVSRINECVQMIEDIASQTNLLSLNASIEAARAGEAGKGFAVVAEEIRKLADDSQASAGEIKDIITQVISISENTVAEAKKVFDIIDDEQKYIGETQEKFSALSTQVDASINEIQSIRGMAEALGEIKNSITSGISDLGAMSEELGASAEEVASRCSEVTQACEDTQYKTQEMKKIGLDLGEAISVFKI